MPHNDRRDNDFGGDCMAEADGFTAAGLAHLHDTIAVHVDAGRLPGAVIGVRRFGTTHTDAIGAVAIDGAAMESGTLFRITSMTRPITAVATLLLIQDGRLALDDPVDSLLPELATRRVLRRLDADIDDTIAAERSVTVRDLLTFRGGFGMILAPTNEYPILQAENALELSSVGPPIPVSPHGPDEWMRRMGTLPLMDQPGIQWRYNTGSLILGVLIARAAGEPAASFYERRIFDVLGMHDTAFQVPATQEHRLASCYEEIDGHLAPYDDNGEWLRDHAFTDCGGGLISTVSDYLAFATMLLNGGTHDGTQFLAPELLAAMTTNQLTAGQRDTGGLILDGRGWGFGVSIIDAPAPGTSGPKGYGWNGGFGTAWVNDPAEGLVGVLMTQVLAGPGGSSIEADFWDATYGALTR
jgi:CubicO group peptidase (beta-lactamase class C family)